MENGYKGFVFHFGMVEALKLVDTIDSGNIVVVFLDRGNRYFSKKIYYSLTEEIIND